MKKSKDKLIVEILGLLQEHHKDRDWLIQRIEKSGLEISVKPTMKSATILALCSSEFLAKLFSLLNGGAAELADNTIGQVRSYHWFFTDIVASANPTLSTEDQARRIVVLNELVAKNEVFRNRDPESTLVLPTGDGMAIGFSDSPEAPLLLAIEISKELSAYNKLKKDERERVHIRIGLDSGPVFLLRDVNGQPNAWGQGLIMARRIMDLGKEMHILASDNIVNSIHRLRPGYKGIMHIAGYYSLKHDERALVFNIYGEGFGNRVPPDAREVTESTAQDQFAITTKRFLFSSIEIIIEIKDIKSMFARHTVFWSIMNITTEPIQRVFYSLDGDVPKKFSDLHVKVSDEKDRELQIISILANKPHHKEFYVAPSRPFAPLERGRTIKLQYDWEEPERQYLYRFASNCSKFRFKLIAPKKLELQQKVVKVDVLTGEKMLVTKPASINVINGKVEMTWSEKNLTVLDAYRFDW